jgi:3-methylcrotonyl-CoA carboxylase alpha subunit
MLVEKYITKPRHIEVQVFADQHGNCVALGERDCSIQRRHQKILEESPAPHLDDTIRHDLWSKAREAALAVGYEGAGTVEFIFDNDTNEFFFMEMNTRLQVEHPVTEMVTGEDLVKWQLIVAEGGKLPLTQDQIEQQISQRGHAIEARIYAENPEMNFMPDSGTLLHLRLPPLSENVRVDAGFIAGDEVSSHYDPMIAKLIVRGETREQALQKMGSALESYEIGGPVTNIEFLKRVCASPAFIAGEVETGYINKYRDELFAPVIVPGEAIAQAAIGLLLQERASAAKSLPDSIFSATFVGNQMLDRSYTIAERSADINIKNDPIKVSVREISKDQLEITVNDKTYKIVLDSSSTSSSFTSFYPHGRFETTFIRSEDQITIWQQGQQYRFELTKPSWVDKALGVKDLAHSVLTPMPCKLLRVDVKEGDEVKKGQILAVIESMKMETVIRSPVDGIIERVVHKAGVSSSLIMEFNVNLSDRICVRRILHLWSLQNKIYILLVHELSDMLAGCVNIYFRDKNRYNFQSLRQSII